MGVIVNKNQDKDSELTRRINADLRSRAAAEERAKDPDLAEDSEYVEHFRKTGRFGWVWIVLVALALVALVVIVAA